MVGEQLKQLAADVVLVAQQIADVGAIKAGQKHPPLLQLQPGADLVSGAGIGRSGECQPRHGGKSLGQHRKLQVFRAEVMPPLGNAVGLINGKQGQG